MEDTLTVIKKLKALPEFLRHGVESAGWSPTLVWLAYRAAVQFGLPQPARSRIQPRQAKHPMVTRLRGSSDLNAFNQVFLSDEYACLRDIPSPRLILDLGANVGYSSAYFLGCFPTATVVAVEPAPDNFEVCRENLASYGDRARVLLGAAWSKRCRLVLSRGGFGDGREWATQVHEAENEDGASVEAWDIPTLLELSGETKIDLLKIDIERSELKIFGDSAQAWLPKVRNICIEFHGTDCENAFFNALQSFEFDLMRSNELTICRNLKPKRRDSISVVSSHVPSAISSIH